MEQWNLSKAASLLCAQGDAQTNCLLRNLRTNQVVVVGGGDICSKHWHVVVVITSPQLRALLISRRVPSGNVYNFSEPVKTKSAESILKKFVWNALRPK